MARRARGRGQKRGRGHTDPSGPSTVEPEAAQPPPQPLHPDQQPFTSLLRMPLCQHKVSKIHTNGNSSLTAKGHRPHIPYNPQCESALKNLGLFHVAQIGNTNIDKAYITILVERWRPETHTFHMPMGELTITLQDVACLWGLPISGVPVSGVSDSNWSPLVEEAFGIPAKASMWVQKKRKVANEDVYKPSRFSLSLSWLRENFSELEDNATPEQIHRVMRQFGLFQMIPPPDPLPWDTQLELHDVDHTSMVAGIDWRSHWQVYVDEWVDAHIHRLVYVAGTYDEKFRLEYMEWFESVGMRTVFLERYFTADLHQPRPAPLEPVDALAYVQRGDLLTRQGVRALKDAHWGIRNVLTRGLKRIGKALLLSCRGHLEDVGQGHRLDRMLIEAGLPTEVDNIEVDGETEGPPGLQPLQCTDADWYSLYGGEISFFELLRRSDPAGASTSQPLTQDYPRTQDSQHVPPNSVPDNFDFDISVDDPCDTHDQHDLQTSDDDDYNSVPLALRRTRRDIVAPKRFTDTPMQPPPLQ